MELILLDVQAYAKRSNCPVATIRKMCKENILPSTKIGVKWRIDALAADEVIRQKMAARQQPTIIGGKKPCKSKTGGSFLERLKAL